MTRFFLIVFVYFFVGGGTSAAGAACLNADGLGQDSKSRDSGWGWLRFSKLIFSTNQMLLSILFVPPSFLKARKSREQTVFLKARKSRESRPSRLIRDSYYQTPSDQAVPSMISFIYIQVWSHYVQKSIICKCFFHDDSNLCIVLVHRSFTCCVRLLCCERSW